MPESDDEYVQDVSDDDIGAHQVSRGSGAGARGSGRGTRKGGAGIGGGDGGDGGWEVTRTWEQVREGADGTIDSTVDGLLEAGKRRRCVYGASLDSF